MASSCQLRDVSVVHALTQSEYDDLERTSEGRSDRTSSTNEIREAAAAIAAERAQGILDDFEPVGLVGSAGERIIEYAGEQGASFIVTSGRKRSPVGKVLFGSVPQSLILNADCPVLSVMNEA